MAFSESNNNILASGLILTVLLSCIANLKCKHNVSASKRKKIVNSFTIYTVGLRNRVMKVESGADAMFLYTVCCGCTMRSCIQ